MKLDKAIETGEQTWSHYTAWQTVLKNLRRFRTENKWLRQQVKALKAAR